MSKFKVGDRVRFLGIDDYTGHHSSWIDDWSSGLSVGSEYTIKDLLECSDIPVELENYGYYLPEDIFELVESEIDFNCADGDCPHCAYDETMGEEVLEEKALRYNSGKLKWSLVHFASLVPLVQVLMMGAEKYAPDNWKKGFDRRELLDSAMRHMTALIDGEENDPESGLSHAAHIMCNMMFYCFHFVIKK